MNVSGVGLLSQRPEARGFAEFLLSVEGQRFFATDTAEYPLVEGMHPDDDLRPLRRIRVPTWRSASSKASRGRPWS